MPVKSMRRLILSAILLITILPLGIPQRQAHACGCIEATPEEAYQEADFVFGGTVIDRNYDSLGFVDFVRGMQSTRHAPLAEFSTTLVWKGDVGPSVVVESTSSSCQEWFKVGETYLVYADEVTYDGKTTLYTEVCMGTLPIEYAADHLVYLGEGSPPTPHNPGESSTDPVWPILAGASLGLLATIAIVMFVLLRRRRHSTP